MSEQNVEVARAIYAALAGRTPTDLIDAEAEYVNPGYAVEPGTRPWPVAIERLTEIYPDFRLEPEEYIDAGDDHVIVIARAHAKGASGVETTQRLAHVWTFRDGRAVRFRWFKELAEAFEALSDGEAPSPGSDPATGRLGRSIGA